MRALLALLLVLALVPSCATLRDTLLRGGRTPTAGVRPMPPVVRLIEVRSTHRPTDRQLAAHFCLEEMARSPLGPAGALVCRAFGPRPSEADLQFTFDAELEVENPGSVPLPMISALLAFTAFPEATDAENLGSLCVSLCDGDDCPTRGDAPCRSSEPEIRDVDDFARASVGFLVGLATGERAITDLRVRTIPARDRVRFVASLAIGVGPMTRLLERTSRSAIDAATAGRQPHFEIPWSLEGSVFVEVEGFGRFAASFPEARGSWALLDR
jgi:hypothetical protein